jgi:hypothetical protein
MKSAISFMAIRASGSMPVNMTGLKVAKSCGLLDISVSSAELSKRRQAHAGDMRAINRRASRTALAGVCEAIGDSQLAASKLT